MILWPAVALIGFLVLTGFVIALGANTTARYERERRLTDDALAGHGRPAPVEAVSA
jgi:hypothetical protein